MKGLFKSGSFWFATFAVLLLVGGVWTSTRFWVWLHPEATTEVSNSETLRNVGLLIGGLLAFVFAGWRAWVAERQANSTQRQADAAQRQAETAFVQAETAFVQAETTQQILLNDRYQRGAEMLGSTVLVVRLGGIYALNRLAEEHPQQYHIQVMELLCAFARNPVGRKEELVVDYGGTDPASRLREDIQAVMTAIGSRGEKKLELEEENGYIPNLTDAYLPHLQLEKGNLSSVRLGRANLRGAYLLGADLSGAHLDVADLSGSILAFANLTGGSLIMANFASSKMGLANLTRATLDGANLSEADLNSANLTGASFMGTNLSGADFSHYGQGPATGLTQLQFDCAYRATETPPSVERVDDIETGKPIVWRRPPGFVD